ncbi:MAG: XRE family transcriptional regulator [Pseudomonas sp.]|nr:XRE family transcriptional regulator [Pseudomonas sp.]
MATSAFYDLFSPEEAVELEIRAALLSGLQDWLVRVELTQQDAAERLRTTQARVSDINNGKISKLSIDLLIKLAARAGLHPQVRLEAAA